MCGLAGYWGGASLWGAGQAETCVRAMVGRLMHRGPDGEGAWCDPEAHIALAHRRLAILDMSSAGSQPMCSASGRFVVVFNGEIYNHEELRGTLEQQQRAPVWRGHADTESLLAAIEAWGVAATLGKLVGMFAFALWDRQKRTLTLARDRLGEKPLYYAWVGGALVFGSELKALRAFPGFRQALDRGAMALYLRHNCIPAPHTIYEGVRKLSPGVFLTLAAPEAWSSSPTPYWSLQEVAQQGLADPFRGDDEEAADELQRLLGAAVSSQMVADVPVGAFLSGGVDSSSVVALMRSSSERPVKTFTIGFDDASFNEAPEAKAVAAHLGTEHTELYVTPADAMAVIPQLPLLYDEPFADSSQIPTFLVSRLARQEVTVALSGDGGDELFGGYNRHYWAAQLWRRLGNVPVPLRRVAGRALRSVPPGVWDGVFAGIGRMLPDSLRQRNPGDKLHKLAEVMAARDVEALYLGLVSHWKDPSMLVRGHPESLSRVTDPGARLCCEHFENRMMYLDATTYLPDDILVKVDRAAMGVSLETRVPMLDHRLVEFAWRLPLSMKIRHGKGKWLLRKVLGRFVPAGLVDRPKAGFGLPIGDWLRGPLREWAESLLEERRLASEGYFDPRPIRSLWSAHLSGSCNAAYALWDVLMFQAWLEETQRSEGRHG